MRVLAAAALLLFTTVQSAQALTIRDVVELTKAGITDEVLVALIEVDGGVFATDAATLKMLKDAGVSERVMVALIRSGRQRPPEAPAPAPVVEEPQAQMPPPATVIVEHHEPQVQPVAVPYPVYVPVYTDRAHSRRADDGVDFRSSTYVPFQPAPPVGSRAQPAPQPTYWGFGGKLRPDAWGQPREREERKPDDGHKGDKGDGPAKKQTP
jgi:hypothetical protein